MFIDVHCHLDHYNDQEIENIIEECRKKNVKIIVTQGTNIKSNRKVLDLAEKYDEVKAALGIYPIESLLMNDEEIDEELKFIEKNKDKISAIGEVGIDFKESENEDEHERQKGLFERFVKLAIKLDKPIIVHSRKAEKECIEILENNKAVKVIMHCFNGNFKLIEKIKENGWCMTIPTNVTFSEHFQKAIGIMPIEQLLCETDSPYLHPRKERNNTPENVIESYKKIAEIKKLSLKEVEDRIEKNYIVLFDKKG